jgi:hypothetical protein
MVAALWVDLTYISPNPPFLQGHFGSRNMYQMSLKVLLRIALACGRKVWLHPHHVSSVRFPHPQMGPTEPLDRIIDNRRGEGPPNPGQSYSRRALSKVLQHRTPFPDYVSSKD